ncbi:unnamed protein product [Clonostachys rosea f. rosea IK726]|uniref:Uncharacterized protein n=1 Tax=Clonostachys rosea f. rosea IK726 TaxID=1349383 RepID=A0ACA9UIN2_BIOOC|nr:unnamed protein product [Clonostachys rosea f. rosea IK726]
MSQQISRSDYLTVERLDNIFLFTMTKAPENRLNVPFCNELIQAYRKARALLGQNSEGAVILKGNDTKFFCTGVDLYERDTNPFASSEGFYPLVRTILDFPFPTICLITGHVFGGACLLTMAHDYRIMNSERGYWCMPPVDLGLHFDGIGSLLRAKLGPTVARKVLLQAHKYKATEALGDGIVDDIASPDEMLDKALALARKIQSKAIMGVYGMLRAELYGEAIQAFANISNVYARVISREAKVKL